MSKVMEKITVRPATRADIEVFAGRSNNETIRGFVGELNGKVIAIGGLAQVKGRQYAFIDLHDEVRNYKMHIMRAAIRLLQDASDRGVRFIYAQADQEEPKSDAWLKRLGFEPDPRSETLYRWRSKKQWPD